MSIDRHLARSNSDAWLPAPCTCTRANRRTFAIDGVRSTDNGGALLAAVERKTGVPREHMLLSFEGKLIEIRDRVGAAALALQATRVCKLGAFPLVHVWELRAVRRS